MAKIMVQRQDRAHTSQVTAFLNTIHEQANECVYGIVLIWLGLL